jgi:hypothetical protein
MPLTRNGLPPERIRVVCDGIDIEAVRTAAQTRWTSMIPESRIVIATARVAWQKAYDILITAHCRSSPNGASQAPDLQRWAGAKEHQGAGG